VKKLIINADDLGYTESINKGIIYAYKNGLVKSASLLLTKEGMQDGVRIAKENPGLGLGPHVDLDRFFEIDHHRGVITNLLNPSIDLREIEGELKSQLDKYFSLGFKADHVDSHHHSHMYKNIFPVFCRVAKEYKIPVIRFFGKFYSEGSDTEEMLRVISECGLKNTDHFIEGWYWGNIDEEYQVAELMTHPGYGEIWRETELAHCCQCNLKDYLKNKEIELSCFSDII
jgi:predicted glycoside hydrolase/deacetylase ChbG (UPF0249 family)